MSDARAESADLDKLGVPRMERAVAPAEPDAIPLSPDSPRAHIAECWHKAGGTYGVLTASSCAV